ncbi:hypothetical protein ASPCADRAFT_134714 [Aspergillus carbonarius ITEM 5010]|uniref:Uncharacterized protein n=1 Tax=Aspergillus carbonarius (strain ITEM 5010) TaxID=602072 RepID=A0A1R3R936_ASPC5|nr:hypothetical protein ASPCADRAFT_134714 [Aspergillus carbonarius ITEM 5010]
MQYDVRDVACTTNASHRKILDRSVKVCQAVLLVHIQTQGFPDLGKYATQEFPQTTGTTIVFELRPRPHTSHASGTFITPRLKKTATDCRLFVGKYLAAMLFLARSNRPA